MSLLESGRLPMLLSICLLAAPASALEFTDPIVYQETFANEVAFPTTPEIDELGIGGAVGSSQYLGGEAPTFTGASALASVGATDENFQLVVVPGDALALGNVGLRGRFQKFSLAPGDTEGSFGVQLNFDLDPSAVYATVIFANGGADAWLLVGQSLLGPLTQDLVPLPAPDAVAILSEEVVTIDLFVDRTGSQDTLVGSVQVEGFPAVTSSTLPLLPTTGDPSFTRGPLQVAFVGGGSAATPPDTVSVEMTLFELYASGAAALLPALSPGYLVALAITIVAAASGRRLRRAHESR